MNQYCSDNKDILINNQKYDDTLMNTKNNGREDINKIMLI